VTMIKVRRNPAVKKKTKTKTTMWCDKEEDDSVVWCGMVRKKLVVRKKTGG